MYEGDCPKPKPSLALALTVGSQAFCLPDQLGTDAPELPLGLLAEHHDALVVVLVVLARLLAGLVVDRAEFAGVEAGFAQAEPADIRHMVIMNRAVITGG